ncbi:MAG: type II toxin-antitoxin system VapC family toxin [Nitrospirota bacterium]
MEEIYVPDASVILKWAFRSPDEEDSDRALDFLHAWLEGRIDIHLPLLWSFEVGNVMMMKNPEAASEIMTILLGYQFSEFQTSVELCTLTFSLMKKHRVTFYDSVYHAVAILTNGKLITADEAYCKKVNDQRHVMRLKEWNPGR